MLRLDVRLESHGSPRASNKLLGELVQSHVHGVRRTEVRGVDQIIACLWVLEREREE